MRATALLVAAGIAFVACGSDPAVAPQGPPADAGVDAPATPTPASPTDAGDARDAASTDAAVDAGPDPKAYAAFLLAEPELQKRCGMGCHDTATKDAAAQKFLAGPDVYASLRSYPGIVERSAFDSKLLTKGPHAGPPLSLYPDLEKLVIDWLGAEAYAFPWNPTLTSAPSAVVLGENDITLMPAPASGLSNVHIEFSAELLGASLSISNVRLTAGQKLRVVSPRFVRVLGTPLPDGTKEIRDPSDAFSNADQTFAAGQETVLSPGSAIFTSASWRPFDVVADRLRIEILASAP